MQTSNREPLMLLTLSLPSWQLYQTSDLLIGAKDFLVFESSLLPLWSLQVQLMSCTDAPLVQHKDYRSQNLCNFRLIGLFMCKLWLRFADGENPRRICFSCWILPSSLKYGYNILVFMLMLLIQSWRACNYFVLHSKCLSKYQRSSLSFFPSFD